MRIWLNPITLAQQGLDVGDVVRFATRAERRHRRRQHRFAPAAADAGAHVHRERGDAVVRRRQQFANIILRANPNGGYTRLCDVGRVELGAQDYSSALRFDGESQGRRSRRTTVSDRQRAARLRRHHRRDEPAGERHFRPAFTTTVAFNTTTFVQESIKEVVNTLLLVDLPGGVWSSTSSCKTRSRR